MRASSRHFEIEQLAPGVYAVVATERGYGLCNSAIIDLGGRTVVFDSMLTPAAGRDLARAALRCTGRAPDWVVNSHWHGDHIWGNSSFPGAHVVSSRRVREVVIERSQKQLRECWKEFPKELAGLDAPGSVIAPADRPRVRAWFQGVVDAPRDLAIVPPAVTFDDELVLEGSRRSLRVITYGGGHSPSDVFGYLPDERIILSGDLVMNGLHPSVGDGWPAEWSRILRRMLRLPTARVLPGHGPVGTRRTIEADAQYLNDLHRSVASAIRRGATLSDIRLLPIPRRYRRWRFSFMFPENVVRTYQLATDRTGVRAQR